MITGEIADYLDRLPTADDRRAVAFFDLDGTLLCGSSLTALAQETVKTSITERQWRQSAKLLQALLRDRRESGNRGSEYHRLVRRLSRALAGLRVATLEDLGQSAFHHFLARRIYSEAIALVEAHRRAGHRLVILTSASRYQAEPVARALGIDDICCTQLEEIDGQFTGRVLTPMCFGEGKAFAARRYLRHCRGSLGNAWYYTCSSSDLPLLRDVGHPVVINPSERLREQAQRNSWPILRMKSRGGLDLTTLTRTALTAQGLVATSLLGAMTRGLGLGDRLRANGLTRFLGNAVTATAGLTLEVDGEHHLRNHRPCIFIFNHQSLLDGVILARLLQQDVVAFCKAEMADKPIVGSLLRQTDTIFVDRGNRDQAAVLQQALAVLEGGRSLVIAPEGSRSTLGDLQPFKQGAVYLAKKARVPIVPIVLHNVKDALPKGGMLVRAATVRVSVLEPVPPEALGSIREVSAQLEAQYHAVLSGSREAAMPSAASASAA